MWTSPGESYEASDLDLLGEVVEEHSSTLEFLEIRHGGEEPGALDGALKRLAGRCKDHGVHLEISQV